MNWVRLKCPRCGFTESLVEGSLERRQIFSDLNEEFAVYSLFRCGRCRIHFHLDVFDREQRITCPKCGLNVQPFSHEEVHSTPCPSCGNQGMTMEEAEE